MELVRLTALEACAGDASKAASLIGDQEQLITLCSKGIVAEKELRRIN